MKKTGLKLWLMLVNPVIRRLKLEDYCEFKASKGCIVRPSLRTKSNNKTDFSLTCNSVLLKIKMKVKFVDG